jgi:hypothetical protein
MKTGILDQRHYHIFSSSLVAWIIIQRNTLLRNRILVGHNFLRNFGKQDDSGTGAYALDSQPPPLFSFQSVGLVKHVGPPQ